jgi:CRISPR-associated protein Cas5t
METMQVLRIELVGEVASFRYPHFMWGVQPTFEMPPPATIYGHICSTIGEWVDPAGLQFAYHFTHEGKFTDLEHIHAGGRLEPVSPQKRKELIRQGFSDVTMYGESTVTPFQRELLFRPRLTLYLNRLEFESAFRSPRYTVVFGRSQDLCMYPPQGVQVVTLEKRRQVYYEHTLLPIVMGAATRRGVAIMMPRYLDYHQRRHPTFGQYLLLNERVLASDMHNTSSDSLVWCDPSMPIVREHARAIVWHQFVGES